jgi:hypothetical protein
MALVFGISKSKAQTFTVIHAPSGDKLTIQIKKSPCKSSTANQRVGFEAGLEFEIFREKEDKEENAK